MERALQIVVEALQCVVAATIVLIGLVFLQSPFIPHHPRRSTDSAAVSNLRTINTAEFTYLSSSGGSYGEIADLIAAGLLDDTFTVIKAGYKYSITLDATSSVYTADATPASPKTGRYGYYTVPDAVVRYSTSALLAPAGQSGRPVQ